MAVLQNLSNVMLAFLSYDRKSSRNGQNTQAAYAAVADHISHDQAFIWNRGENA